MKNKFFGAFVATVLLFSFQALAFHSSVQTEKEVEPIRTGDRLRTITLGSSLFRGAIDYQVLEAFDYVKKEISKCRVFDGLTLITLGSKDGLVLAKILDGPVPSGENVCSREQEFVIDEATALSMRENFLRERAFELEELREKKRKLDKIINFYRAVKGE